MTLPPNETHVHYVTKESPEHARLAGDFHFLSPTEHERMARFKFEDVRAQYGCTRVLVRRLLSAYVPGVAPEAWEFGEGPKGKPFVAGPVPGLHFNVTHTPGLIACALASVPEIGIDAENVAREADFAGVARHSFAPDEITLLSTLSGAALREKFFYLWTLKEAYVKARGLGFSMGVSKFSFAGSAVRGGEPEIVFDTSLGERSTDWKFHSSMPVAGQQLAVALKTSGPLSLQLIKFSF